MTDIQRIRGLAERATPGRWMNNSHYECIHTHSELVKLRPVVHYSTNNPNATNDCEYIAALSPDTVLRILAVVEAAVCIHHWHDTANDGMIVSGEHVRKLWGALADLKGEVGT